MPEFLFRPHPKAPDMSLPPSDIGLILDQIISEIHSNHLDTANHELWNLTRQITLTNLWFALKFVAGFAGPYNAINDDLQLDMCNFRQSDACMLPGARWASYIPRGGNKSTIFTHGGTFWELLRNPDLTVLIVNSVEDKAYEFYTNVLRTFRDNELMKWLFPEYIISKGSAKMLLPNRTRFMTADNVDYKGYSGRLEGTHVNLLLFDDAIGVEDLDSQMMASVSMDRAKKKFQTAIRALLINEPIDRVGNIGTLYCPNDLHYIPINDCKSVEGYKDGFIQPVEGGVWSIYYRKAIEDGVSIDLSHYTVESMEKLRIDDPWSYHSQYQNDPTEGASLDFYSCEVKRATLRFDDTDGWLVYFSVPNEFGIMTQRKEKLSDMYCAMGVDFAASNTNISARTSRSAIELFAMDGEGRTFLIDEVCGYLDPRDVIKQMFVMAKRFEGYIHIAILESNALQKFFIPIIDDMAMEQNLYFPTEPKAENLPKEVRIRAGVGATLRKNMFYVVEGAGAAFLEEKDLFPQDAYKRDALDAASKAINALIRPFSEEELMELEDEEEERKNRAVSKAGY